MDISFFAFKLLLLFFPGIICSYIVDTYTIHKERTQFQFLINSFVYGIISYLMYWVCIKINGEGISFLQAINDQEKEISYREVIYTCVLSCLLAVVITLFHTYKLHFKAAHWFGITQKFGELDVWGYFMNSADVIWVTVRDLEHNLMYDGWVQAFSDNSKDAEILLGDVKVFKNIEGEFLYEVSSQYLSLEKGNISIEVRKTTEGVENDKQKSGH